MLRRLNVSRIAVGHTPEDSVRVRCGGRLLALDSTLSRRRRGYISIASGLYLGLFLGSPRLFLGLYLGSPLPPARSFRAHGNYYCDEQMEREESPGRRGYARRGPEITRRDCLSD